MARPRKPDGRRIPVSFKLTEEEAALVDSLRGDVKPGPWMRDTALEAARSSREADAASGGGTMQAFSSMPPAHGASLSGTGTISALPPGEELPRDASLAACPHPPARILRGLCNACGRYVGS